MMKCKRCNVLINTNEDICPLCKNKITGDKSSVFPEIPTMYHKHNLMFTFLRFISIFGAISALLINIIVSNKISWAWFVMAGIASFWFTVITAIKKRNHFMKMLFREFMGIIILAMIWDYFTGKYMWSINYVLPLLCVSYIAIMFIMRIFFKYYLKDYILYIYLNCMIGLVPFFFLLFNVVSVRWPSINSVIFSLFALTFMFIFNRNTLKKELSRRFHF